MRRFLFMKRKTEIPENGLISSIYLKCMTFSRVYIKLADIKIHNPNLVVYSLQRVGTLRPSFRVLTRHKRR